MPNGVSIVFNATVPIPLAPPRQGRLWRNITKSSSVDRVSTMKNRKTKENQFAKSVSMSSKIFHFAGRATRIILITLIARDVLASWIILDVILEADCIAYLVMTNREFQFALLVDDRSVSNN